MAELVRLDFLVEEKSGYARGTVVARADAYRAAVRAQHKDEVVISGAEVFSAGRPKAIVIELPYLGWRRQ